MNLLSYITNGFFSEEIQINNVIRLPIISELNKKTLISNIVIKNKVKLPTLQEKTFKTKLEKELILTEIKKKIPIKINLKIKKL